MSDTEAAQIKLLHMLAQHQMAVGEYLARTTQGSVDYVALIQRNDDLGKAYCEFCQQIQEGQ